MTEKSSRSRQIIQGIVAVATILSAAITSIDSYNTRGIVWQAIQTGEPLLVALVLLQTPWFLFVVFFAVSSVKFHYERNLTRSTTIWSAIGSLIASFLLTWGVRGSYFGVTGQNYPGQSLLEFRLQTVVAGIIFFLFGIIILILLLVLESETDEEFSNRFLVPPPKPITDPEEIKRLQSNLRMALETFSAKHNPACKECEKSCRKEGMIHYNIEKKLTDCTCPCHK